ncbi:hypothetical protein [Halocynthiibacter styelae]|uniref:hypothetical protein n=1 Tax=Halocynthiibacter styelae TaxID=2761955 RepID=UPI0037444579
MLQELRNAGNYRAQRRNAGVIAHMGDAEDLFFIGTETTRDADLMVLRQVSDQMGRRKTPAGFHERP